jgi:hypothetical protein
MMLEKEKPTIDYDSYCAQVYDRLKMLYRTKEILAAQKNITTE